MGADKHLTLQRKHRWSDTANVAHRGLACGSMCGHQLNMEFALRVVCVFIMGLTMVVCISGSL